MEFPVQANKVWLASPTMHGEKLGVYHPNGEHASQDKLTTDENGYAKM